MLLNEIVNLRIFPQAVTKTPVNKTKKVQPVELIASVENESDGKKKPDTKGRIDTYA